MPVVLAVLMQSNGRVQVFALGSFQRAVCQPDREPVTAVRIVPIPFHRSGVALIAQILSTTAMPVSASAGKRATFEFRQRKFYVVTYYQVNG